jgi:hypothetical protein
MAEIPDMHPEVFVDMRGVMGEVLAHAAARGEIATDDLPARVVTLPVDLLRHQLLLTHDPIEDATLTEITDDVFLPLVHAIAQRA